MEEAIRLHTSVFFNTLLYRYIYENDTEIEKIFRIYFGDRAFQTIIVRGNQEEYKENLEHFIHKRAGIISLIQIAIRYIL
jgi:hypothetical protein